MLMRPGEIAVDVGYRPRIIERLGKLARALEKLDGSPMLGAIVVIAPDERGGERERIGLSMRIKLGERFLEAGEPARIADGDVGIAHFHLDRGARVASRRLSEGALVAFHGRRNDAARLVDVAD